MKFITLFAVALSMNVAFCSFAGAAAGQQDRPSGLEWQVVQQWQLPASPIDIVHSLDGKYVFVLTDDQQVLIYTPAGNLEGTLPVDKGVSAIDIAPRAELLYLIDSKQNTFSTLTINFVKEINTAGSPFRGPEDAPVTVVLFTDFECPYCSKVEPLMAQILEKNPETVKLVFKNMPLQFHKFADPAARAALAAGKQGKFWEFHDALFAAEKLSNQVIADIAVALNLDIEQWKQDKESQEIRQQINRDLADAQQAGVTGTPTIYINGRLLKERNLQGFQHMINEELQK